MDWIKYWKDIREKEREEREQERERKKAAAKKNGSAKPEAALAEPETADINEDAAETAEGGAEPIEEAASAAKEAGREREEPFLQVKEGPQDPLEALQPADVFAYFREIAAIPHGSFHTEAISSYLEEFARAHGLPCSRDEMGNIIITRPASHGCEGAAPVALQGHMDMVCEKEASCPLNMETDPLSLQTDGEWLWAQGTTLGGDDGIAVAMMLALLADGEATCPPLECIFTVDEEVGLLGAGALDVSGLHSRRMVNLDSEEEGILTAGCAGGAEAVLTLDGRRREKKGQALSLHVSGLRGGHSGEMIGAGRANADLLLARLLYRLQGVGKYCIVSMGGGNRDNAIPREARAEILFTGKIRRKNIKSAVAAFAAEVGKEYALTDPDIRVRAQWYRSQAGDPLEGDSDWMGKYDLRIAFSRKDSARMVRFLMALPNGVIEYLPREAGKQADHPASFSACADPVPQTSLSLGIVQTLADGMRAHTLVRSSLDSQKQMMLDRIACIADEFGAALQVRGAYPAWEMFLRSDFRNLAAETYEALTGKAPQVSVTHGGLECGLLAAKIPGLDCISIGPDMREVHTPAERLSIPSAARTYAFLKALLAACAAHRDNPAELCR